MLCIAEDCAGRATRSFFSLSTVSLHTHCTSPQQHHHSLSNNHPSHDHQSTHFRLHHILFPSSYPIPAHSIHLSPSLRDFPHPIPTASRLYLPNPTSHPSSFDLQPTTAPHTCMLTRRPITCIPGRVGRGCRQEERMRWRRLCGLAGRGEVS